MSDQTPSGRQAVAHAVNLEQCSVFMHGTPSEKAMLDAAKYLRSLAAPTAPIFECAARKQNTGGGVPADCDWPVCGCDTYANKVIGALEESGVLPTAPTTPSTAAGERVVHAISEAYDNHALDMPELPAHAEAIAAMAKAASAALATPPVQVGKREGRLAAVLREARDYVGKNYCPAGLRDRIDAALASKLGAAVGEREALRNLEEACDAMAAALPASAYNAITDSVPGISDLRLRLDEARSAARATLAVTTGQAGM